MDERLRLLDARALNFRSWIRGDSGWWRSSRGWRAQQSAFPNLHCHIGNAENIRELRAACCFLLLRPRKINSRAGKLRIRPGSVCTRTKLIVNKDVHELREGFSALDIRLGGTDGLFRRQER